MASISVIMSVYNTEEYLDKSIPSVLSQSFTDFEFIIINNGSIDGSLEIIKKYQVQDNRIVLINNEKNYLLSEARNQALDIAKGKYVYIVDSDDYIDKDTLDIAYKYAEENNLDLVIFGWYMEYILEDEVLSLPVKPEDNVYDMEKFRQNAYKYLNQSVLTVPWNKLYLNSYLQENKIRYRNTKLEDHHFNMDVIKDIRSVGFISTPLYHYYRNRSTSELNYIYKFDLFKKKEDHYLHTKEVFEHWNLEGKEAWNTLYSYFAERIIQCVQEIVANNEFTKKEKKEKIKAIFKNENARFAIKKAKPKSKMMRILLIPLRLRWYFLTVLEAKFITRYKEKNSKKFIKLRADKVNNSKME